MHNRARLVVGSFLTKDLYVDWRLAAALFAELLVDGDVAQNTGNWQRVAGTGANPRPHRVLNPVLQAKRHDPNGDYVRRHVEELADVPAAAVLEPWKQGGVRGYPAPLVDRSEAAARLRRSRKGWGSCRPAPFPRNGHTCSRRAAAAPSRGAARRHGARPRRPQRRSDSGKPR